MILHQPRLLVQTRGPLVVRDLDLLGQFNAARINVSIPTDSEEVRQAFEPKAPPLERRWQAAMAVKEARLPVGICVTPMLPLENADAFVRRLVDVEPDVLVVQDFHDSGGAFGADTGEMARRLLAARCWTATDHHRCVDQIRRFRKVYEGEAGFFPPDGKRSGAVQLFCG
jgi:DNA repair photolyase